MRFEIIETPDNMKAQKPLQKTFLLSNKDNRVSDVDKKNNENGNLPFSKGDIKEKNIDFSNNTRGEKIIKQTNYRESRNVFKKQTEKRSVGDGSSFKEFSKKLLTNSHTNRFSGSSRHTRSKYDQTETSTQNSGGITFNTYNWEYAPYLLYLKERIQNNIYPPTSFTRLGFSGENIIRFIIYPDGKLENPNVRGFRGSEALVETSVKAVEMSAPFKPLPEDFPENFLVVTAKFSYYLLSNN
ncbi:MAG: energy transducer TonB [bacterium]